VQAVRITPAVQNAPGKFIDNLHLSVLHHVVNVQMKKLVGFQRLRKIMYVFKISLVNNGPLDKTTLLQNLLNDGKPLVAKGNVFIFFIDLVIADNLFPLGFIGVLAVFLFVDFLQAAQKPVNLGEFKGVVLRGAGNDQRCAGFVDKDGIDLINNAIVMAPLYPSFHFAVHIVAQIIKAEFVVGSVSDVAGVIFLAPFIVHVGKNRPYSHAQVAENRTHPFRVPACQVIVDRDNMYALAGYRV